MADPVAGQVTGGETQSRGRVFGPLRARGVVLIVLLAGTVVAAAGVRVIPVLEHGASAYRTAIGVKAFVVAYRILSVAAGLVFLAWFRRARISAEGRGWHQRFARAWTFWGWIVPVANLWIPLQIMDDIWQASFPRRPRGPVAWLPTLWWANWTLWGALLVLNRGTVVVLQLWWTSQPPDPAALGHGSTGPYQPDSWPSLIAFAVAGLALISIVWTVSHGPLAVPAAAPRPKASAAE